MIVAGIDIGSLTSKAVILQDNDILSYGLTISGADGAKESGQTVLDALKETEISFDDIQYITSTGAGKDAVTFAGKQKPLPSCLARGASWLFPKAKAVIDIGAESSTVVKIGRRGRAIDFVVNDVCAAGTGIFLDTMAKAMRVPIEDIGRLSMSAEEAANISSMCVVFAESEIVSLVHKGVPKNNIIAGIHKAIAERIFGMSKKINISEDVVMSGGVARNIGITKAFESKIGHPLYIPDEPQYVAALGAALIAMENV